MLTSSEFNRISVGWVESSVRRLELAQEQLHQCLLHGTAEELAIIAKDMLEHKQELDNAMRTVEELRRLTQDNNTISGL